MDVRLRCHAEPQQGKSVPLAAKICFMLWPFYALCDKGTARICLKICHFMVEVTAYCVARSPTGRSALSYARVTARAAMRILWHIQLSTTSCSVVMMILSRIHIVHIHYTNAMGLSTRI
jgi:hypothetical protein